jgi:hypothetical protein
MGSKTTTLEVMGILLHMVNNIELMQNRVIIFQTDNMACYYGWENKQVKEDEMASIIFRSIALLGAKHNCDIHVQHVPRLSSWEAKVVDRLSRVSSTSSFDRKLVNSLNPIKCLSVWVKNPREDWSLPIEIMMSV